MLELLLCLDWSAMPGFVLVRLWEGDLHLQVTVFKVIVLGINILAQL